MIEMIEMVELIVMLKSDCVKDDVAPLAESVHAQIIEIKMMFDNKIVGLLALEESASEAALVQLKQDSRVELAQINRTYKHC